ncbi:MULTISPECIES: DUF2442 domain-containing protein [Clostridium]|jgi:hypothetical protein|uniref:DUF2442 domain-containing protein n=1 Tax=Clostridium TaxID=1485 RepID=UPI0005093A76|nr:DUF2442 domain-containing protein [Clostridium saudiense]
MEAYEEHIPIIKMRLEYPFIYAEFENGEKRQYDINTLIPFREEYKKLYDVDFFNQAELSPGGLAIFWNDFIDTTSTDIYENGGEI